MTLIFSRFLLPFSRWGNSVLERLNDSPKGTIALELLFLISNYVSLTPRARHQRFPATTQNAHLLLPTYCIGNAGTSVTSWVEYVSQTPPAVSYGQCSWSGGGVGDFPWVALPRISFRLIQGTGRDHPEKLRNSRIGIKLRPWVPALDSRMRKQTNKQNPQSVIF